MARPSLRDKIVQAGVATLHERGFTASGVRDVMVAAGAPLGSFSNHFRSKEAFGLAVLNRYFEGLEAIALATLCDDRRAPLNRLHAYFDRVPDLVAGVGWRHGCLIGNMSLETAEHSEALRGRLAEILATLTQFFANAVRAAQVAGQARDDLDADDVATLLLAGWEGARLKMKVDRSPEPLERFRRAVFAMLLPSPAVRRPREQDP